MAAASSASNDDALLHLCDLYRKARTVRTLQGHEAAQPLYQDILLKHKKEDRTAATRIAAAKSSPTRHDQTIRDFDETDVGLLRDWLSKEVGFTHKRIQKMLFSSSSSSFPQCCGPIYLRPCRAGDDTTTTTRQIISPESTLLEKVVALFLLGVCIPRSYLDVTHVQLLERLGLAFVCEHDPSLLVPYVHIFPLDTTTTTNGDDANATTTLWFITDLHPNCLSTTTVADEGAVMYIGPDSLALVQHMPLSLLKEHCKHSSILDICCGSGIQALVALKRVATTTTATCIDINPRALRFTRFNACLNGFGDNQLRGILGNVLGDEESMKLLLGSNNKKFDVLLANPPFIPTPPQVETTRYGLFSSGGPSGEEVLQSILTLAKDVVRPDGLVAIVSEFMNPDTAIDRLRLGLSEGSVGDEQKSNGALRYWKSGFLFTNQYPLDALTYAQRRADSDADEVGLWLEHMHRWNISHVSPGLLFLKKRPLVSSSQQQHTYSPPPELRYVPKTKSGSIWTPTNQDAIAFTRGLLEGL